MPGKRGHPYRVPNDPATRTLKVKMTDTEYYRLKAMGQMENKTMSDIVREQLDKRVTSSKYRGFKVDILNSLTQKLYEEGE